MKTNLEKLENDKVQLEITMEEEETEEAIDKASRELANKVKVPGFRKGKVPRNVIEARLGQGAIMEEALETLLPEGYGKAIEEKGIEPIDQPQIEIVQAEPEKPLVFKATVQLRPEAELGEYKGVEAKIEDYEVTDQDVDNSLEKLRETHSKMINIEGRAAEKGDHIVIDFEGFIDGQPFEGGSAEGYSLELGSESFIPGFEEQLFGVKTGQEKEVKVSFPEDYHVEELAGKESTFKVSVKEIKKKILPELDDDFAKTASEFATLQELREDTKENLEQTAVDAIKRNFENEVLLKVVENADAEVPQVMVEKRMEQMMERTGEELKRQGISMEDYLKYVNKTEEELKEEMKPNAEREVKTELVLEAVAKEEGLEASEEDINEEINKIAEAYSQEPDTVRSTFESQGTIPIIEKNIQMRKAISFLTEHAEEKKEEKQE